jgi:Spo0E like sporulation regulatory protein
VEDMAVIETTISHLRREMVKTYEKVGDLGNETVIALSQQLDVYLLRYQQQSHSQGKS